MSTSTSGRKRKAVTRDVPVVEPISDDEFEGGLLDGVLEQSEDEEDSELDDLEDEEDEEDSEEDEDEDEEIDSDEIPSDDEESSMVNAKAIGTTDTTIAVPGLDNVELEKEDISRPVRVETDANGGERYIYTEIDPVYDSDDSDAQEPTNTIGDIPLSFYEAYPHIGYDINGKRIMRPAKGAALDALLDSIDIPKGWTGLTDPATGKPLELTQEELEILKKLHLNEMPDGYDPYPVSSLITDLRERS
jgi:ribosome biogenesis protein ERB1